MSELTKQCLEKFPELLDQFPAHELDSAADLGNYIFFEDFFNEFVVSNRANYGFLQRIGRYIEELIRTPDDAVLNLVEIGILEGLVARGVTEISPFIGENSRKLLSSVGQRIHFDKRVWRIKQ